VPYSPKKDDLGVDAQPNWQHATELLDDTPVAAIAHKMNPTPSTWTVCGWRYISTTTWADVDSAGVCYATGKVHAPWDSNDD
jgi:hypothetical protein